MKIYSYQLVNNVGIIKMTAHVDMESARRACQDYLLSEVSLLIRRDKLFLPELKEIEEYVKQGQLEQAIEKYNNYKLHFENRILIHGIFEVEMLDLLPKAGEPHFEDPVDPAFPDDLDLIIPPDEGARPPF